MKRTFHSADALEMRFCVHSVSGTSSMTTTTSSMATTELEIISPSVQFRVCTEFNEKAPPSDKKYTGPQNAQELMKALDADYNKGHAKTEVSVSRKGNGTETESYSSNLTISEIDARYRRAEWLQLLLERGIIIGNFYEYASTLSHRHALAFLEDNPNLWQSGVLDIPPTNNWETYKAAYINKLVEIEGTKAEIEVTIEHSKAQVERAKVQIEHSKKDLEHAKKQIASAQVALEHLKEPMPPQEPN